jgi:hypothetical protein
VKTNSELYQADKWRIQAEKKTENRRSKNKRKNGEVFPSRRCKPIVSHKSFGIFHTLSYVLRLFSVECHDKQNSLLTAVS